MAWFHVVYIGIGGRKDYAAIEAEDAYEARKEFEEAYWSYHEILRVEPSLEKEADLQMR